MNACARCGKPVPPGRRVYCGEGCADLVAHEKRLARLSRGQLRLAKFHVFDYRQPPKE
jgi:predicted nucleic acid-binding Zn ribbon protein